MAEAKKTRVKDEETKVESAAVGDIDWPSAVDTLTTQKKALEDYVASILPDLHLARVTFAGMGKPASERFNSYYQKGRDLIGEKGMEIDKTLRS